MIPQAVLIEDIVGNILEVGFYDSYEVGITLGVQHALAKAKHYRQCNGIARIWRFNRAALKRRIKVSTIKHYISKLRLRILTAG